MNKQQILKGKSEKKTDKHDIGLTCWLNLPPKFLYMVGDLKYFYNSKIIFFKHCKNTIFATGDNKCKTPIVLNVVFVLLHFF